MLRAQRKLGSDDGMGDPEKPNGMHWSTYNRLLDRPDELDDLGGLSAVGGLLQRAPGRGRVAFRGLVVRMPNIGCA
jgi:hypothetical protein